MKFLYNILATIKHKIIFMRFGGRVYRPDTIFGAEIFYKIMIFLNKKEFKERKNLIEKYKESDSVNKNYGFGIFNLNSHLSDKSINSLKILKEQYNHTNWDDLKKNQKKSFLMQVPLKLDSNLKSIVNELAPIVGNYIGSWPVLLGGFFWYSENKENFYGRSQNWHMDAEDKRQIKLLIPVENISTEHGPMNVIPTNHSKKIYKILKSKKKTKYRNQKHSDEIIFSTLNELNLNKDVIKKITLNNNEFGMIDTCSCYHFGSRKALFPRKIIALHFTSAFSIETPIFNRNIENNSLYEKKDNLLYCFFKNNYFKAFKESKKLTKWKLKIL